MCTMEFVAWLAGEDHGDEPRCACPVLTTLVRAVNDLLPDDEARDRYLRSIAPRLVNSRGSEARAHARALLAADCAIRFFTPLHLDRLRRGTDAARLRNLPEIEGQASAVHGSHVLQTIGPVAFAARWVARQIAAARPDVLWVAGVAHAAASTAAWQGMRRLLEDMIDVRDPTVTSS